MGRNLLVIVGAIIFGICGTIFAGETEIILKDVSSNSGFSVKDNVDNTIMRVRGDGSVRIGLETTVSEFASMATGQQTIASGKVSTAWDLKPLPEESYQQQ